MEKVLEKQNTAFDSLKGDLNLVNKMQTPRIRKVVVSSGIGKIKEDKKQIKLVGEKLALITGQKASLILAKKSIATFKVREGQASGYKVTLRGKRMRDFIDKLLNVALPRTRDFRGINTTIDEMGNYTLGLKENTIFTETADDDLRDVFGMSVTVVTTSKDKETTKAFLDHLGFPFKK